MREIERKAETLTRRACRNRTRRKNDSTKPGESVNNQTSSVLTNIGPARPFEDIEPW